MSAIGTKRMPTGLIQINADLVRRWYAAAAARQLVADIETTPAMMAKDANATFVSAAQV